MSAVARAIRFGAVGIAATAVVIAEVWWAGGGLLHVPIPLARPEGLPLPVCSWAALLGFAVWRRRQRTIRHPWGTDVVAAFAVHALVLVARLGWDLRAGPPVELAGAYLRYWQAVWTATLAVGIAVLGWSALQRRTPAFAGCLGAPMAAAYGWFWGVSWRVAPAHAALATVTGGALLMAWRLPRVRAWAVAARTWASRERVFLSGVFLAALALRLFYSRRILATPDFLNTGSDGPAYDALAWALVHGGTTSWSHLQLFAPGYVRFLALVYWVVGRNYLAVCAAQSVIGALTCLLLYAVAKRLTGPVAARIAAVFAAVNFPMIFAAAAIGHQALDLFWTLLVVWCLLWYLEHPDRRGRWVPGIGALLGWAAATREGNLVLWAGVVAWWGLGMRRRLGWARTLAQVALFSIGFWAVMVPFVAGNGGGIHGRLGAQWFISQTTNTNLNLWFNPWHDPEAAWKLFQAQPLLVLAKVAEGLWGNFNAVFLNQGYGSFDPVFLLRGSIYAYGMWVYAYGLAFAGLAWAAFQAGRQGSRALGWWLILVVLVTRSLPHLFFEAAYRHRVPFEPYLILLASVTASQLAGVFRQDAPARSAPRTSGHAQRVPATLPAVSR